LSVSVGNTGAATATATNPPPSRLAPVATTRNARSLPICTRTANVRLFVFISRAKMECHQRLFSYLASRTVWNDRWTAIGSRSSAIASRRRSYYHGQQRNTRRSISIEQSQSHSTESQQGSRGGHQMYRTTTETVSLVCVFGSISFQWLLVLAFSVDITCCWYSRNDKASKRGEESRLILVRSGISLCEKPRDGYTPFKP
jgi:hypothetical protein